MRKELEITGIFAIVMFGLINITIVASVRSDMDTNMVSLYEPPYGCYIGAYMLNEDIGNINSFEYVTGKHHAIYHSFSNINDYFIGGSNWFKDIVGHDSIPMISVWYPYNDMDAMTEQYAENWAEQFNNTGPVFIRYAWEMNIPNIYADNNQQAVNNPDGYKLRFQDFYKGVKKAAPNVMVIWCVNDWSLDPNNIWIDPTSASSTTYYDRYYPGDDYVDWVGVDSYLWHHVNGYSHEDRNVLSNIDNFYIKYSLKKPVMIGEVGIAKACKPINNDYSDVGCGSDTTDWANNKYDDLFNSAILQDSYPRLKAIIYFNIDKERYWSVTDHYGEVISSNYFIGNNFLNQQTPDLNGTWSGTLTQGPGGCASQYQYSLTIRQSGTMAEGESTIQSDSYYGFMKFSGTVTGEILTFTETMILENHPPSGCRWYLKTVTLLRGKGATPQSLDGIWGAEGSKNLGGVFLTFGPSNNPPNNTPGNNKITPGFELLLAISAIAIVVLFLKRKCKKQN